MITFMIKRRRRVQPPAPTGPQALGQVVNLRRGELGMTQAELAARAGVGERTIRNLEQGQHAPQARVLAAVARVLNLDAAELRHMAGVGEPAKAVS